MNESVKASRSKRFVAVAAVAGFAALIASPAMAKAKHTAPAAQQQDTSDDQDSDLRLALDKVQLDLDSGKLDEAQSLLEKLNAKYPGNPDVQAAMTDLNDRFSGRSTSLSSLCLPNSLEPNNTSLLMRERVYGSDARNSLCGSYNRRVTPQGYEQISSADGQVGILPSVGMIFDLENDHLNTSQTFTRVKGMDLPFYGARQQGTVTVAKTFTNHWQAGASVFGNDTNAGGGVQFVERDRMGGTAVQANFQQPNWDYVEMVAQNGTRTNIRVERKQDILNNLQATLGAGFNHYSLDHLWTAGSAPEWDFNLDYSRPVKFFNQGPNVPTWMNDEITLGAHYGVQAEYFTTVNHRGFTNVSFSPLPVSSYEIHSFVGSISKTLLTNVDAEVEGGYGVDRWSGTSGPVYGGSLAYTPFQHLGIDVHAERTLLGGQNESQKQDLAGASVKWTW